MDVQKTIEFLLEQQAAAAARQATHDAQIGKLTSEIGKLIELQTKNELLMADLITAVMSHERRISGLENRGT